MTAALIVYSAVFMRYSVAVRPKNYLLFGMSVVRCARARDTHGGDGSGMLTVLHRLPFRERVRATRARLPLPAVLA